MLLICTATPHVWMAPAWQEIIWRAAQRSLAVMCPAFGCSPNRLLALMESANRGLITRTGSTSHRSVRLLSVASDRPTVPSRVIALSQAPELAWQPRPPWPCAGNSPAGASPPRRCAPSCSLMPPPRQGLAGADAARSPMDRHWSPSSVADWRWRH